MIQYVHVLQIHVQCIQTLCGQSCIIDVEDIVAVKCTTSHRHF